MCHRENTDAVVPVHVVLRSIEDAVQLVTMQTEQVLAYIPVQEADARSALMEALSTAMLLRERLAAIQEGLKDPKMDRGSTLTFFDGKE